MEILDVFLDYKKKIIRDIGAIFESNEDCYEPIKTEGSLYDLHRI